MHLCSTHAKQAAEARSVSINVIKRITGNGVTSKITYDPATLRPTSILTTRPDDTVLENLEYTTYDKMGNITKITDLYPNDPNDNNIDDTETFTYDPINRLTKAVSAGLYGTHDFIYSASGNLTSKEGLALTYGDSAHPHAVTAYDGKTYSYDAAGNMISRNGKTYVYDAKSRLIQVMNGGTIEERYFYDYSGFRAGKILADGTMIFNLNGLYELRQIPGQTQFKYTNFIYGMDGDLIAQIIGETTWEAASIFPISKNMYNWKNFKGFFLKIYASASAWIEKPDNVRHVYWFLFGLAVVAGLGIWAYNVFFRRKREIIIPRWMAHAIPCLLVILFTTFGLTGCFESLFPNATVDGVYYFHPNHVGSVKLITNQSGGIVARYKYTPYGELLTDKSSGTDVSKYKYTAQEEDSTTGLYYYNSRFYDPDTGRFITPDCIVPDPTNTQAFNKYMYVQGNPVNMLDTSGQWGFNLGSYLKKLAWDKFKNWVKEQEERAINNVQNWYNKHGNSHEWQNQYKHWFTGNVIFLLVNGDPGTGFFSGLITGLGVEVYQFFKRDDRKFHLKDRFRDIHSYGLGGTGIPAPYNKMKEDGTWSWQWSEIKELFGKDEEKKEQEGNETKENSSSYYEKRISNNDKIQNQQLNIDTYSFRSDKIIEQMFDALSIETHFKECENPIAFIRKGNKGPIRWSWDNLINDL